MSTLDMTGMLKHGTDQEDGKEEYKQVYYKSKFSFLMEHRGYRPGSLHLILARKHAGKTTLLKSLIWDLWEEMPEHKYFHAHIHLSEYSVRELRNELIPLGLPWKTKPFFKITVTSEKDDQINGITNHEFKFKETIANEEPDILFFDNLTTSRFYNNKTNAQQAAFSDYICGTAESMEIPIVVIAHTHKNAKPNEMGVYEGEDIRGDASIVNNANFLYTINMFQITKDDVEKKVSFIYLDKHRSQPDVKNYLFMPIYNSVTGSFMRDKIINWSHYSSIYDTRIKIK